MMEAIHRAVDAALPRATSKLERGISSHTLQNSIALSTMREVVAAAGAMKHQTFVGSVDGAIMVSVNANVTSELEEDAGSTDRPRKRRRCPHEEEVQEAAERVRGQKGPVDIPEKSLAAASAAALYLLKNLRGSSHETAIESWALTLGPAVDAERPKLVLSMRLSPGLAVSLYTLLHGIGKSKDGMLTTSSEALQQRFNLPLNAEARTTEKYGQKSMSLFATMEEGGE